METIEGFVILNVSGHPLSREKRWNIADEGWVWTSDEVDLIIGESRGWRIAPFAFAPATWSEETGLKITGEAEEISKWVPAS